MRIIALILSLAAFMLTGVACSEAAPYDGTWKSSRELGFTAHIHDGQIRMTIQADEYLGLYWKGTFAKKRTSIFISRGDTKAMDASILGSLDSTKKFTIHGNTITFRFSALGLSRSVTLKKKD
jgi:hypothetical protein